MIIFDQLRITDDGVSMLLDCHVNQSSYFDNVYIESIYITTEDYVSSLDPFTVPDDYIYKTTISTDNTITNNGDIAGASTDRILSLENDSGGWAIPLDIDSSIEEYTLNIWFSGIFSSLGTSDDTPPILIVTDNSFDISSDTTNSEKIYFSLKGERINPSYSSSLWRFKGNGTIPCVSSVTFYLYSQANSAFVTLSSTDNSNYLHSYWQLSWTTSEETNREGHLILNAASFNEAFTNGSATVAFDNSDLTSNMFFVYVVCGGTPDSDTPCRLDEMTTLGVTFDYNIIYQKALMWFKHMNCEIPKGLVDFILNYNLLKMAIETEHYIPAIETWKLLTTDYSALSSFTSNCGCHG